MKLTSKCLRRLIKESIQKNLLIEGVADTVARSVGLIDPERIEQLRIASEKPHKLQKPDLIWIGRFFMSDEGKNSQEPIEDIVKHIKEFKRSKNKIQRVGGETDIEKYKTPTELTIASTYSEGRFHEDDPRLEQEARKILEVDGWQVWLPLSREASCTLGSNTAWCTALSGRGNNLFYNYVLREGVILYYVVYNGQKEINPQHKKVALGVVRGRIYFPEKEGEGNGHITVDTYNKGVTKNRFEKIIQSVAKPGTSSVILKAIENNAILNNGVHPTASKIKEILNSPLKFSAENRGKSKEIILDFIATSLEYAVAQNVPVSQEVINEMSSLGEISDDVVLKYKENAPSKLFDIAESVENANRAYRELASKFNYNTSVELITVSTLLEPTLIHKDVFPPVLWEYKYQRLLDWAKHTHGVSTWEEAREIEKKRKASARERWGSINYDSWQDFLEGWLIGDHESSLIRTLYDENNKLYLESYVSDYIDSSFEKIGFYIFQTGFDDGYDGGSSSIFSGSDNWVYTIDSPGK